MDTRQPMYLYRAVFKDLVEYYKNSPNKIPELEGRHFVKFERLNPYAYEHNKRYLHFLDNRVNSKQYAESLELSTKRETCVLIFKFDPNIIESCRTTGKFIVKEETYLSPEETIDLNEYIIPAELYNPAVNFVGVLEKDTNKNEPNVFAVLPESEVEYYATNLDYANGLEYTQEQEIVKLLDPESLQYNERAIHLFSSQDQAKEYLKSIKKPEFRGEVVPFSIDQSVLDCCFSFETKLGVTSSTPAKKEYLMPISQMTTDYYYEEGNASQKQVVSYDPDNYRGDWFF